MKRKIVFSIILSSLVLSPHVFAQTSSWSPAPSMSTKQTEPCDKGAPSAVLEDGNTYTLLYDAQDVQDIQENLFDDYFLCNDVDMDDLRSFNPVGPSPASPFKGTLNGNNKTISNLKIVGSDYVGLFGSMNNAVVKNLVINNADVRGNNYVGTVAGYAALSEIENVRTSGTVRALDLGGAGQFGGGLAGAFDSSSGSNLHFEGQVIADRDSGGLVGSAGASIGSPDSVIFKSSSIGILQGTGIKLGGLVGVVGRGIIDQSYSKVHVNGGFSPGGLVGSLGSPGGVTGTIINSYSRGDVMSTLAAPAGSGIGIIEIGSSVTNVYATGKVTASDKQGLIADTFSPGTGPYSVTSSYWDVQATGTSSSEAGEGKTTAEMLLPSTYVGWDFYHPVLNPTGIWDIKESYPFLKDLQ